MVLPKGNLLIGQSGGPTPVINTTLAGIVSEAKKVKQINKIYGLQNGIEGIFTKEVFDLSNLAENFLQKLLYTPAAILGSSRHQLKEEEHEMVIKFFKDNNIRYFSYIGGNGSMGICNKISQLAQKYNYEMQVIGLPKTIDNDLYETDHSPGFGSAARFVALSTAETGKDLATKGTCEDVIIYEVMGRHVGWLAAASVLGKKSVEDAPHLIYLPERVFSKEKFLQDVEAVHKKLGYVYIVISEGLRGEDNRLIISQQAAKDSMGRKLISLSDGPGSYLAHLVRRDLGLKCRCNRPGTIQRAMSSYSSNIDIDEAFRLGQGAVKYFAQGLSDIMVTLKRLPGQGYYCEVGKTLLENVANKEKFLPQEYINKDGNFVSQDFYDYCLPLIGENNGSRLYLVK